MTDGWPPERTATLISLWNEEICASEIARRLGTTKNAVIGKAFRLQLRKRRPSPPDHPGQPAAQNVMRLDRLGAGMCSWPLGETGRDGFHFCGEETLGSKPYCAKHCGLAYVPATNRRRAS
jgi:GcrA cell cycle regulator